ncbi:Trm112 family protein [Lysobacter sp. N42]|jgi:uncharacterized protein YbaR (Trm112 family)|uniref:Trm112 family protein n=1 Tax=Lysobacter sp. N42 TaxID=2545719 RepID=UPI001052DC45|nr:Trm112 family protein [Lysobacter sp. N42]TCZ88646.1 Trm112 family protein [Lysobacter sp. N42]
MDRKLLDLLACPTTRQPLRMLDAPRLDALNRAIEEGRVRRGDGAMQSTRVEAALCTEDGRLAYRIDDGIPVLLAEESLDLGALAQPA